MKEGYDAGEQPASVPLGWALRLSLFAAVLAMVYLLGTSLFSAARMQPLMYPFLQSQFHISGAVELFRYQSIVRWTFHYLEYFVLFLSLVWLVGLRPVTALIFCLLLAAADEGHQYLLPDRSCSLVDFSYDAAGAATAFVLVIAARWLQPAPAKTSAQPQPARQIA